jgi:hypothetical protein
MEPKSTEQFGAARHTPLAITSGNLKEAERLERSPPLFLKIMFENRRTKEKENLVPETRAIVLNDWADQRSRRRVQSA